MANGAGPSAAKGILYFLLTIGATGIAGYGGCWSYRALTRPATAESGAVKGFAECEIEGKDYVVVRSPDDRVTYFEKKDGAGVPLANLKKNELDAAKKVYETAVEGVKTKYESLESAIQTATKGK